MLRVSLLIATCIVCASVAVAQDEAQYQTWMRSVGPIVRDLRMAITAKDNGAVSTQASKLSDTFEQVAGFWRERHVDDAVKYAEAARDNAKAVAAATSTEEQTAGLQKVQAQCGGCHMAHREGMPGSFKIK